MTRRLIWLLVVGVGVASPLPTQAYLKFGVRIGGRLVDVRWDQPIRYFVNDTAVSGVSAADLQTAITRAFSTWQEVPTAAVQSQFVGFTQARPGEDDGRTTFGFLDRPELDRVLGATSILIDAQSGAIIEADVFFNTRFAWSVAPNGENGRIDLQSVALHEIGHLLGLGHSAIGETEMTAGGRRVIASGAVMFPIAFAAGSIVDRTLQPDDRAAISDMYPSGDFNSTSSSISGTVTKNGAGVFGAHLAAVNLATGAIVGGFTLGTSGDFVIGGLEPGTYVVRAEPLDDADPESFFVGPVDVDFRVAYCPRLIIAPRGGNSDPAAIEVRPK
jgi:hypothetical protein